MFSKLATFRSKGATSQTGKPNDLKRYTSQLHTPTSKSNGSFFPSKSDNMASKATDAKPTPSNADVSHLAIDVSERNLSIGSIIDCSTSDGKESIATSSSISEEIYFAPSVLLPYEDAEEQFLEEYEGYFLHIAVNNVRKDQYPKLELQRIVYLDFATCPLYSVYQVEHHMQYLLEETEPFLGSKSTVDNQSALQNSYIDSTCKHILNLLNTTQDEYSIIFTPGLASCYRIFGEMFDLRKGSVLLVSQDHHKSVQHVVQAASSCKMKIGSIPLRNKDLCIHGTDMHKILRRQGWSAHGCGLLVFPAQSFVSGVCHPLNWIAGAQQNGWEVLLDVSSCLPMVMIDLSLYQPEFVIGSLHHILGYPSSVGFLLVRRKSYSIYYEKGSTCVKLAKFPDNGKSVHVATEGEILNTHMFAALSFGLEHLESIGITAIQKRVESLMAWLIKILMSLKHKLDGNPLLQLYGSMDLKYRGSILAFNVLDSTGNIFPARLVQQLAERSNIILATTNLNDVNSNILRGKLEKLEDSMTPYTSRSYLQVVRLSLGPVSTFEDVYKLAQFLSRFRDEDYMLSEAAAYVEDLENEF